MLSVKVAARVANVSTSLVYAWCKAGVLKHSRFGRPGTRGCVRIAEADLRTFLDNCQRAGGPAVPGPFPLQHIVLS